MDKRLTTVTEDMKTKDITQSDEITKNTTDT